MKKVTIIILVVFVVVILIATSLVVMNNSDSKPTATDYSKPQHWLNIPQTINKTVDVFYIYPTTEWYRGNATGPEICEIDNSSMMVGARGAYARQATAFEPVANVFAPYYRQMDMWPNDRDKIIAGIPTTDAVAAFDYYIKNFNDGRPFILAGHSQGSTVLTNLLAGYMSEHRDVYDRMIVAYVIGYTVNETYLANNPHLKFATGPDDTGVIVSYNTESPNVVLGTNPVHAVDAITINPISWTREETLAPFSEGLGSYLPNSVGQFEKVPQYADAKINKTKGALITTANLTGIIQPMGPGILHSYDYPLYYFNLRANAAERIDMWFLSKQ
jgi:hypothetical protein